MNKLIIGLLVTALGGGAVYAAQDAGWMHGKDKALTRAEAQTHAGQMFDRIDVNKDGKLDPADREAHHAAMFDKIDTDRNGQISRSEFAAHKPDHRGQGGPEGAMEGHDKGMRGHGKGHGGMGHRGMGGEMAAMADANKDGAVSREEFNAAHAARFAQMDANKDGTVTPEERRAARMAMWQSRAGGMHRHGGEAPPAAPPATGK